MNKISGILFVLLHITLNVFQFHVPFGSLIPFVVYLNHFRLKRLLSGCNCEARKTDC